MDNFSHYSVLLNESIELLEIKEDGIYIDATTGGAGHSLEIVKKLKTGHLYCFDQDAYALNKAKERLSLYLDRVTFIKSNFSNIKEELSKLGVYKIDGIIYDLGVSSFQLDIPERGFSYRFNALLDMRMDECQKLTARDIVNNYSEKSLSCLFYKYSGSKYSSLLAKNICLIRDKKEINTTFELVDIIKQSLPQRELNKKGHPAKVFFQALRIEVNEEIYHLEKSLNSVIPMLNKSGVILAITFQPDEDKIVMQTFKQFSRSLLPSDLPIANLPPNDYKLITNKQIKPSLQELEENNRSHSAKLRGLKRFYINGK